MSFLNRSSLATFTLDGQGSQDLLSTTQVAKVWPHEHRLEERDAEERVRKTLAVQRWRGLIS